METIRTKNLNTHEIRVFNKNEDTTYEGSSTRPIIKYDRFPDTKAPGAFVLKTMEVEGLPLPKKGTIYIVNRDTISATRKIEKEMRTDPAYRKAFYYVKKNKDWQQTIQSKFSEEISTCILKYVHRYDLRAPGEQVRDSNHRISHCLELISEFE